GLTERAIFRDDIAWVAASVRRAITAVHVGLAQDRLRQMENAGVLQVRVIYVVLFMAVDWVFLGVGRGGGCERERSQWTLPRARCHRFDHERVTGGDVVPFITEHHRPAPVALHAGSVQVRWSGAARQAIRRRQILPRNADDHRQTDECRRPWALTVTRRKKWVVDERARAVLDLQIAERAGVALDGLQEIEAETPLLFEATQVERVVDRVVASVRLTTRNHATHAVLSERRAARGRRGFIFRARATARVVGVGPADAARARHAYAPSAPRAPD